MNREAWRAEIHGVAKSWTQLSDYTTTTNSHMTVPSPWKAFWMRKIHSSYNQYGILYAQ